MNPLYLATIQMLQAFGLLTILQNFFVGLFALALLFAALNYFKNKS